MFTPSLNTAVVMLLIPTFAIANEHHEKEEHHKANVQNEHSQNGHNKHSENSHGDHHDTAVERIQVRASRLGLIVTDSATRTEVINAEEIQEKAIMRPGNILSLIHI